MAEKKVKINSDVELWSDSLGDPSDPTLILIHGAGAQATWFDDELCGLLVSAGRHVIRFDHRDSGASTARPYEEAPYNMEDLASDAIAVLDAYGVDSAHIVGLSIGGAIALYCGINHPERVKTLTAIYSSPILPLTIQAFLLGEKPECDLPLALPADYPELVKVMTELQLHPPETRQEHVDALLEALSLGGGSLYPFDEVRWRPVIEQSYDRATDWDMRNNLYQAILASESDMRPRLRDVAIPTLVISGSEDAVPKWQQGKAIADAVKNGTFELIEGTGHSIHVGVYPIWVDAIIKHTA